MQYHSFEQRHPGIGSPNYSRLALSISLHCLLVCGLAEIAALLLAASFGWNEFSATVMAIPLAFIFGFGWTIIPLHKKHYSFFYALRVALFTEGPSIAVMEIAALTSKILLPVFFAGSVHSIGMHSGIPLLIGFLAALPVNYLRLRRTR